ncbi:MAG: ankyrin repeat domain-containing protein [Rectinemataceae bacterium]|jgi:hypothetical protein
MIKQAEKSRRIPHMRGAAVALLFAAALASLISSCSGTPEPAPAPAPTPVAAPVPTPAPEPPKPNLADLIAADDQVGIRTFFASQDQLNTPDAQGSYPLHRAIEKGSAKTLELLLLLGAKPELKDQAGRSPLRLAIDRGAIDCVKILVSKGADIFSTDPAGTSALEAVLAKGGDTISAAFNAKNVNARSPDGRTALHIAADRLLEDQCSRLLSAGADPNLLDASGRSALDLALLHPDRIEAARVAEILVLKGGTTSFPDFAWFAQAARALDYGSLRYEDGGTPLHQAVSHKQKGFVEFLISRKVNPNVRNGAGSAPLHEAIRSGWLEGTEILLKGGADPNVRDGFDNSPLHIVLPDEVRSAGIALLLKYGADPSLKDRNGNTPLHVAIQVGYALDIVRALLAAQAPVNAQNAAGDACLHVALRAKRYDYAKSLLDAGADIFLVNGRSESPLSVAISLGPDALDAVLTQANVRTRDNYGNTPLAIAVGLKAAPDAVAMIIAKGSDVNARNNAGDTPLHIALRQGLRSQGEALLLAKADIFAPNVHGDSPLSLALTAVTGPIDWFFTPSTLAARDANGDTPLHHAAKRNLAPALEFLVQKGSALEAANSAGETALHQAVKADAAEAVRSLLALGAALSARDAMGDTPLHSAVLWAARKSLPILTLAGADINARDFSGETPLHQAVRKHDRDSLKYLLDKGADPDARDNRGAGPLAVAVKSTAYDLVRDLLAANAEIDERDQEGKTPLLEAASMGDADSSRTLVGAGADIMARDGDGDSPLTVAVNHSPALLKVILTEANVNRADPDGKTPLRIIVESRPNGLSSPSPESLDLVVATGARLDARDRFSATSLHAALRAGDRETAARLAKAGADVFARDKAGETPVSLAMAAGIDTLKALVTATGMPAKDRQGNGWLHYAAIAANADAVTWLLAAGADRTAKNISGETAYDIAQKRGKAELAALLKPGN